MSSKLSKRYIVRIVAFEVLIVGIIISSILFFKFTNKRILQENEDFIALLTEKQAAFLDNIFKEKVSHVSDVSLLFAKLESNNKNLEYIDVEGRFDDFSFIDLNGNATFKNQPPVNVSEYEWFKNAISGKRGINNITTTEDDYIIYYCPYNQKGRVTGIYAGLQKTSSIEQLITYELYEFTAHTALCRYDGQVICSTTDVFSGGLFSGEMSAAHETNDARNEKVIMDLAIHKNAALHYKSASGKDSTAYFAFLENAPYFIFQSLPYVVTDQMISRSKKSGILLLTSVLVLFALYIIVFILTYLNELKTLVMENLKANYDPLTSLLNRRSMSSYFKDIQKSAEENSKKYSLMMLDLDDFKSINDKYGHECGDKVLIAIAETINKCVRQDDKVFRWGGEEILINASSALPNSIIIAERIRKAIEELTIEFNAYKIHITVTIGVTEYCAFEDVEDIIEVADKKLYIGKQSGKNQVVY